jgi:hypothetical protein
VKWPILPLLAATIFLAITLPKYVECRQCDGFYQSSVYVDGIVEAVIPRSHGRLSVDFLLVRAREESETVQIQASEAFLNACRDGPSRPNNELKRCIGQPISFIPSRSEGCLPVITTSHRLDANHCGAMLFFACLFAVLLFFVLWAVIALVHLETRRSA